MTVYLDFETYYDSDYSLRKMSYIEYIRDPRFKILGCAVAIDDSPSQWYGEDLIKTLAFDLNNLANNNDTFIAHNALFDGFILTERLGIKPKMWGDTLAMSRAVLPIDKHNLDTVARILRLGTKVEGYLTQGANEADSKLIEGALRDVDLCRAIYNKLLPFFPEEELRLIDITTRWGVDPLLVLNENLLEQSLQEEIESRNAEIHASGYTESELCSDTKFAAILNSLGVPIPKKISKATEEETTAFAKGDAEFQELMASYPQHQALWTGRLAANSNIMVKRTERLLNIARQKPTMPMPLKYYGARTGRWSGSDGLNVQNLPKHGKIRESFRAPPGHKIVVADSEQIELRVNMWFCRQWDKLKILADGGDLYRAQAVEIFGGQAEDYGKESKERAIGKALVLGCFAGDTKVLTNNGVKQILDVMPTDKLWDGIEWITHTGVIYQGLKRTINLNGVKVTPNHLVLCGKTWLPSRTVAQNENTNLLALATGSANLPLPDSNWGAEEGYYTWKPVAHAEQLEISQKSKTSEKEKPLDAIHALKKQATTGIKNTTDTPTSSQTTNTGVDCWIESLLASTDVTTRTTTDSITTADGEYKSTSHGELTGKASSNTSLHWKTGTSQNSNSTELMSTTDINQVIYDSLVDETIVKTDEKSVKCKSEYSPSNEKTPTYDISYAGPRNRFTIISDRGPLIVHNCGYGMGWKRFQQFVAAGPLGAAPIHLSEQEAYEAISAYRRSHNMVQTTWNYLRDLLPAMTLPNCEIKRSPVTFHHQSIALPNGMSILYTGLHQDETESWIYGLQRRQYYLHGGKILENIIQALARIIIGEQLLAFEWLYPNTTVSSTHDEIIAVVPEDKADNALKALTSGMSISPSWAPDLPLGAVGHIAQHYGKDK